MPKLGRALMALPDNLTRVPITGKWNDLIDVPPDGMVYFDPPSYLTDTAAKTGFPIKRIVGRVVGGILFAYNGTDQLELPANDDPDITPTEWRYKVTEKLRGQNLTNRQPYYLIVGKDRDSVDLSEVLTDPGPDSGTTQVLPVPGLEGPEGPEGPPGPPGDGILPAGIAAGRIMVGQSSTPGDAGWLTPASAGLATPSAVTSAVSAAVATETGRATAAEALLIPLTQRGTANGVPTTDASNKIPPAFVPDLSAAYVPQAKLQITGAGSSGQNSVANPTLNSVDPLSGTGNTIAGGGTSTFPQLIAGTNSAGVNTIGGGYDNSINVGGAGAVTIAGGAHHRVTGAITDHATIGGGSFQTISDGHYNTISGGTTNKIDADGYNTISGGGTNEIVGGPNATISGGVAHLATGPQASIGGGSSNVAEGSSTRVDGGNNNAAYGTGAKVGGGVQNVMGATGTTRGQYAVIAGGFQNVGGAIIDSSYSAIGGGRQNITSIQYATVPGGRENEAHGIYSHASGYGAKSNIQGQHSRAAGYFTLAGDAQSSSFVLRKQTTDATPTVLTVDGASTGLIVTPSRLWAFTAIVAARKSGGTQGAAYEVKGAIRRGTTNASNTMIGTPTVTVLGEDDATWNLSVAADTTTGQLAFTVTGVAATTINWVADLRVVEVG